jgi:hypothetical protein
MSAQQFVSCEVERDISRDRTGVREPMLNRSAAINNRGSLIGHNLITGQDFPKEILHCLFLKNRISSKNRAFFDKTKFNDPSLYRIDFVKNPLQRSRKTKNMILALTSTAN